MIHARVSVLQLLVLALAAEFPARGQSVVSTHSGVIYFFEGSVFVGDQQLEQKFGKFPDIGEGRELRTEQGRAEVILTPGVLLRIDENSAVRMLSNKLSDTRVELVRGSAIIESNERGNDTSVKLIYRNWQVRVPHKGVCRIDSDSPQLRMYQGEGEVSTEGNTQTVAVREGEVLPLAAVLVTERPAAAGSDAFKSWAMSRSQAISADNAIAAEIVDDAAQFDNSGLVSGGLSYFPLTGVPSLGITNPYGLSFWSPYQSTLSSIYFPPYAYGPMYRGWPIGAPFFPRRIMILSPIGRGLSAGATGLHPSNITSPRVPFTPPPRMPLPSTPPHATAPRAHVGGHTANRR
jgi:hypothetical protein